MHDNLEILFKVTKGMSEKEKTDFAVGLVGSLSALVDPVTWEKAVMTTATVMKDIDERLMARKLASILRGGDDGKGSA